MQIHLEKKSEVVASISKALRHKKVKFKSEEVSKSKYFWNTYIFFKNNVNAIQTKSFKNVTETFVVSRTISQIDLITFFTVKRINDVPFVPSVKQEAMNDRALMTDTRSRRIQLWKHIGSAIATTQM